MSNDCAVCGKDHASFTAGFNAIRLCNEHANVSVEHVTALRSMRALESIARSLEKMANPMVTVET